MANTKATLTRRNEAITYLRSVNNDLANQIGQSANDPVINAIIDTIADDVSLGKTAMYRDNRHRLALRALMLCQRYYFTMDNSLDWKRGCVDYWKLKSRASIDEAIRLFAPPTSTDKTDLARVAQAAGQGPTDDYIRVNYRLSRNDRVFDVGGNICFGALLCWLLKSGIVSYQWFLRNGGNPTGAALRHALGPATQIWQANHQFTATSVFPNVRRGYIINLNENGNNGHGHWMVSVANGLAAGVNNAGPGNAPDYCASGDVAKEFYFRYAYVPNGPDRLGGVAHIWDPLQIPNRGTLERP